MHKMCDLYLWKPAAPFKGLRLQIWKTGSLLQEEIWPRRDIGSIWRPSEQVERRGYLRLEGKKGLRATQTQLSNGWRGTLLGNQLTLCQRREATMVQWWYLGSLSAEKQKKKTLLGSVETERSGTRSQINFRMEIMLSVFIKLLFGNDKQVRWHLQQHESLKRITLKLYGMAQTGQDTLTTLDH